MTNKEEANKSRGEARSNEENKMDGIEQSLADTGHTTQPSTRNRTTDRSMIQTRKIKPYRVNIGSTSTMQNNNGKETYNQGRKFQGNRYR